MSTGSRILDEGLRIAAVAKEQGIILRIMGAGAVRIHCHNNAAIHKSFRKLTDVDYMAYWKQEDKVDKFLKSLGYEPQKSHVTPFMFITRRIYRDATGAGRSYIDVFFDKLEMNHTVDFKGKLELDYPTIPLTELLLQKAQIVFINEKDIKDIIILFLEHEASDKDEKETFNGKRIAKLLSKDWGFWHTFTANLDKAKKFLEKYDVITNKQKQLVAQRIDKLREMIDKKRKSFGWRVRSGVGTKKIWYNPVEEVERAEHLEEFKMRDEFLEQK